MLKKIPGLIRIKDVERIIDILDDAFCQYPKFMRAFPNEERRRKVVAVDFRFYATYGMRSGGAYGISKESQGVVIVTKSNKRKTSKLKYWLMGSYSKKYQEQLAELTEEEIYIRDCVDKEGASMESEIEFPKKYLYIRFLGVKKQYQGQGIGKGILEAIIAEGKRKSLPIVFHTSEPKNVAFYQQLGFKIMGITSSKQFEFINIYLVRM